MGDKGPEVEARMAAQLGLQSAGVPMRSSYDRVSDYVSALGLMAATAQKIAHDVVFMQRTEIGEVEEAFHMGKVGSSTMAQKRNPSTALMLISLARMMRARVLLALESMVRMDEGDSSATNVADTLLPEVAIIAASIAECLGKLAGGLVVHPQAMRRNLDVSNGLIAAEAAMMRLTEVMGRHEAHHLLYEAAQRTVAEKLPFMTAIREHPMLAAHALPDGFADTLDAGTYVGQSAAIASETVARVTRK
jgi:adenylosuccinate lyase/3-carboxy-cis,cis-muconate cycloisomerase